VLDTKTDWQTDRRSYHHHHQQQQQQQQQQTTELGKGKPL
jgi:hypothetical protein